MVVGDVVAGAVGAVLAGVLVGLALLDGAVLEDVGGAVTFGSVVAGGEVARGGGHGGSRELADNSRNWPMASSRVPAGSPA